jgi:hypothetical protein
MRGVRAGVMKVIFLDIDGVLNSSRTRNPRKFPYVVEPRLLRRLKKLIDHTGAKVVLSSSWRLDPIGLLAARYWGIPFIDVCPDKPRSARGQEVLSWLSAHPRVKRFVVIDDEDDELDGLPLFQPRGDRGLSPQIVKGVERYLSGASDRTMPLSPIVRVGQNVRSLFKRDKS